MNKLLPVLLLLLFACPVWGAITYIGESSEVVEAGSGTETVTLPTSLENDIIVAAITCDEQVDSDGIDTATETDWVNVHVGTSAQPGRQVVYLLQGATPNTTVAVRKRTGRDQIVIFQVFRGVDTTTPIDLAHELATGGSLDPDSPSITTVTDCAWVLSIGLQDDDTGVTLTTAPSGYTNAILANTGGTADQSATACMASKEVVSNGAEDPGVWDITGDDAWAAYSVALRPAATDCAAGGRDRSMTISIGGAE